jgi:hypothetical protein
VFCVPGYFPNCRIFLPWPLWLSAGGFFYREFWLGSCRSAFFLFPIWLWLFFSDIQPSVGLRWFLGLAFWLSSPWDASSKGAFSMLGFFSTLVAGGLFFYIVTNTAAWMGNPSYPRGLEGLWMSLTTGLPGMPPSWVFYRNALFSDLIFGAMLGVWVLARRVSHCDGATLTARIR